MKNKEKSSYYVPGFSKAILSHCNNSVANSQCGNLKKILPLRLYVKPILAILTIVDAQNFNFDEFFAIWL